MHRFLCTTTPLIFWFSFCFSLSFPFALSAMRNPKLPLWFLNGESTADALKKQPTQDHHQKASILLSSSHKHSARQKTSTKTRRKTAKTQKQRKTKTETQTKAKTHTSNQREALLPHKSAQAQAYACVNVACSQSHENPDKKAIVIPVIYQRNSTSSVSPSPTLTAAANSSSQPASSSASVPSSIPSSIPLCSNSSSLVVPALSPVPSPLSTVSSHTTSVPSSVPTSSSSSSSSRTCTLDHTHLLPHSSASFAMPHSTPVSEGKSISLAAIPPCEPTVLIIMYLLIEFCFGVLLLCWFAFIMVVLENEQSLSERSAE